MKHEHYPHKVTAVYQDAAAAADAVTKLEASGLGDARVMQLSPDSDNVDLAIEPEPEAARDTLARTPLPEARRVQRYPVPPPSSPRRFLSQHP